MENSTEKLESLLGHSFSNHALLMQALTSPSWLSENPEEFSNTNQRLEFLGDGLLQAAISLFLYSQFPKKAEGELTNIRAVIVDKPHLADVGMRLNLWPYVRMSEGARKDSVGKSKLLADTVEALIAVIHLDGGDVQRFVANYVADNIEGAIQRVEHQNPKSKLQEILAKQKSQQGQTVIPPVYIEKWRKGPDSQNRMEFCFEVFVDGKAITEGFGQSIKDAQVDAARQALKMLKF
jgi:ribonuclease III